MRDCGEALVGRFISFINFGADITLCCYYYNYYSYLNLVAFVSLLTALCLYILFNVDGSFNVKQQFYFICINIVIAGAFFLCSNITIFFHEISCLTYNWSPCCSCNEKRERENNYETN